MYSGIYKPLPVPDVINVSNSIHVLVEAQSACWKIIYTPDVVANLQRKHPTCIKDLE